MTTMIGPLRRATQIGAERTAITCGHLALTYGQTWERCRRLVGALRGLGVGVGDRVAVLGPNCHRYLEIYQSVPGAGMVLVPLNQRHTTAELIRHCRTLIAGYKVPKRVELRREPLPKSGAGKLLKRELREPFWKDRASRVAGT